MKRTLLLAYGMLALFFNHPVLFAKPAFITLRVIDARNGQPYQKLQVRVELLKERMTSKGFRTESEARANLIATRMEITNAKGEIKLDLAKPFPGVISIDIGPMGCGPGFFDTDTVITSGVVGENHCKAKLMKMRVDFRAKPGEIVYFATPVGFVEGALTK